MKIRINEKKSIAKAVEEVVEAYAPEPAPINYETTKEYLDSIYGDITKYGVKIMADGRQWVLHCITGKPFDRREADPIRDARGNVFWKKKGEDISVVDRLVQLEWGNPDRFVI